MKILITNDDGIQSPALPLLAEWAKKLGEVTVAAPKVEQSGKSQAINFMHPVEIVPVELVEGVTAYAVDSTPADCVRFGVLGLMIIYGALPLYRKLVSIKNEKLLNIIAWIVIAVFVIDWILRIPFGNNYTGPI